MRDNQKQVQHSSTSQVELNNSYLAGSQQILFNSIEQKERYLSALLDTFPFIVWMKDKEGRFLANNIRFAEVCGVETHHALQNKTDFDFFPAEMAQGYVDDDNEVLRTGLAKNVEEIIQKANGEKYLAETFKSPVLVNGEVIGTVGFSRDISELRSLQKDFLQTKSEYSALIDSLPLVIVRYDLDCKRTFLSLNWEGVTGSPSQQLLGKTPLEYWYPVKTNISAEDFQHRLKQVMATGESQMFELYTTEEEQQVTYLVRIIAEFDAHKNVVGALTISSDISEVSEYRQQVEYMAYHDMLTDLPNRSMFNKRIVAALQAAQQYQQVFGVLMIDLDHFKSINDTLGHNVGDELLIEVAARIVGVTGGHDKVARLGGDEFAVLVEAFDSNQDLSKLAVTFVQALAQPFYIKGQELFVTASIGIAVYPDDSQNVDDLLRYADVAMYSAKKQGRNNHQFFKQEFNQTISQRLQMQTGLMHAIEKKEFYLHYQPLVQLHEGKAIGVEALLRWNNKVLGEVSPVDFIPLAEELGVIIEIGQWVMMRAFADAVTVNANREKPLQFAVNLSPRQFLRHDIFSTVRYCLSVTACQPAWIKLEITESLLLNDSTQILNTLRSLVSLGVSIAIDDFGTGYSSLSYLNKFPIDEVKIDRSFVRDITTDENDAKLVKAVIGMALSLGKELIAEGVETQAQVDLLKSWGCNIAQGYLFNKPVGFAQLIESLNLNYKT